MNVWKALLKKFAELEVELLADDQKNQKYQINHHLKNFSLNLKWVKYRNLKTKETNQLKCETFQAEKQKQMCL